MRRRFRERYNEASDRLERVVFRWLAVAVVILLAAQIALANGGLSAFLEPLGLSQRQATGASGGATLPETYVTIRLLDHRSAWQAALLVNGVQVGTFRRQELIAPVKPGDLVEIDATSYSGAVTFRVVASSGNLSEPRVGDQVTTRGSIEAFSRVKKR